jgi:hypothetical protein
MPTPKFIGLEEIADLSKNIGVNNILTENLNEVLKKSFISIPKALPEPERGVQEIPTVTKEIEKVVERIEPDDGIIDVLQAIKAITPEKRITESPAFLDFITKQEELANDLLLGTVQDRQQGLKVQEALDNLKIVNKKSIVELSKKFDRPLPVLPKEDRAITSLIKKLSGGEEMKVPEIIPMVTLPQSFEQASDDTISALEAVKTVVKDSAFTKSPVFLDFITKQEELADTLLLGNTQEMEQGETLLIALDELKEANKDSINELMEQQEKLSREPFKDVFEEFVGGIRGIGGIGDIVTEALGETIGEIGGAVVTAMLGAKGIQALRGIATKAATVIGTATALAVKGLAVTISAGLGVAIGTIIERFINKHWHIRDVVADTLAGQFEVGKIGLRPIEEIRKDPEVIAAKGRIKELEQRLGEVQQRIGLEPARRLELAEEVRKEIQKQEQVISKIAGFKGKVPLGMTVGEFLKEMETGVPRVREVEEFKALRLTPREKEVVIPSDDTTKALRDEVINLREVREAKPSPPFIFPPMVTAPSTTPAVEKEVNDFGLPMMYPQWQ